MMYTIGELSRITGLSVKALRFYHKKDLLVPRSVDRETKYRYYDKENVEKARMIRTLRSLNLSLEDIQEILRSGEELTIALEKHRQRMQDEVSRYQNIVRQLDHLLKSEEKIVKLLASKISAFEEKYVEEIYVVSTRYIGNYFDSIDILQEMFEKIKGQVTGRPLNLFYEMDFKEKDADVEACLPIASSLVLPKGITARKLSSTKVISCIYSGSFQDFGHVYEEMMEQIKSLDYKMGLPIREVYIKGPDTEKNENDYQTEIQIPIED